MGEECSSKRWLHDGSILWKKTLNIRASKPPTSKQRIPLEVGPTGRILCNRVFRRSHETREYHLFCAQVQDGDLENAAQQLEFLTVMQVHFFFYVGLVLRLACEPSKAMKDLGQSRVVAVGCGQPDYSHLVTRCAGQIA